METEHLLVFPDRDVADEVADELRDRGFGEVRVVREALAGEDDSEDHEWAVHVVTSGGAAVAGELRLLAGQHEGWYDADPQG